MNKVELTEDQRGMLTAAMRGETEYKGEPISLIVCVPRCLCCGVETGERGAEHEVCEPCGVEGHDYLCMERRMELDTIEAFVARVNERAEADMLVGNPVEGAHHRAIEAELARLRTEAR